MKANDRIIYRMAAVIGYSLASLTVVSVVLGWPVAVAYVLLGLLLLATSLERMVARSRRR